MSTLADKLRAARISQTQADGHTYTIRRPTDAEAVTTGDGSPLEIVQRFVIGWDHTEVSLGIPGGSPIPAPFSAELWAEWVNDQPQLWAPLSAAIIDAYKRHAEARKQTAKN